MNTKNRLTPAVTLLLLILGLVAAGPAAAWEGRWLVGFDFVASHIGDSDDADEIVLDNSAGGGGLHAGYLITPSFMLRLGGAVAEHNTNVADVTIRFGGGTLDAVYLFRPGTTFRPYIFGGVGGYQAESQVADLIFDVSGPGLAFGGGAHLQLGRHFTLHGSLRLESINWEEATVTYDRPGGLAQIAAPIDESGWASKLALGVGAWF